MFRLKLLIIMFLLLHVSSFAQKVNVTLKNSEIKIVEFLGMNQEILYLEIDGKLLKIPLSEISEVKDLETDELIELTPLEIIKEVPPEKPSEPLDVMNNISFQPLHLLVGITILELELATTESTSLVIRGIKTGPPLKSIGHFPIEGYGLGMRYRFFFNDLFGTTGFFSGPILEYAKDATVQSYWNTGLELGYQFVWGKKLNWLGKISIDLVYESAKIDGAITGGIRPGLNMSLGLGI